MSRFTLRKSDILRCGNVLESLFLPKESIQIEGFISRQTLYVSPLKCVFMFCKSEKGSLQALFAVPKRNFKRAVKRNLMRRRMKESYRLHKNELRQAAIDAGISISVHLCYYSREELTYKEIDNGIRTIIKEISDKFASCSD